MQDIIFKHSDDSFELDYAPIVIYTTFRPSEDLIDLIERIKEGDTPGARELLAILENIYRHMPEERI